MKRAAALLLLAGLAQAGTKVFDQEKDLWPNGVEYVTDANTAEVHLLLAFKDGICTRGERGTAALASALFVVEYNDADRQTGYWNKYRPYPFDGDVNPEWYGNDDAPGLFATDGQEAGLTDRVIVLRFPRVDHWRIRVTPLYGDDAYVRRGATLVQVAELYDSKARPFEELDPLPVEEEVKVPAEAEEAEPLPEETSEPETPQTDDAQEAPVAVTTVVTVGRTAVRAIGSGAVPRAGVYRTANRAARRRADGAGFAHPGNPADPTWQPLPTLQPTPAPIPAPRPVGGAPVAGTIPPWGGPLPFWAVPRPRAKAPPSAPARAPRRAIFPKAP
jgi:hypothetical protein